MDSALEQWRGFMSLLKAFWCAGTCCFVKVSTAPIKYLPAGELESDGPKRIPGDLCTLTPPGPWAIECTSSPREVILGSMVGTCAAVAVRGEMEHLPLGW